jgi:hypothetical protein
MADPELPTTSDTPAPPEPPAPSPADAAIQEKRPDGAPPATAAVTGAAPAAAPPAEPRAPRKPSPERLARSVRVLDAVVVVLVLALAFFLGAFAVENSDFWMHLATGRLLSEGAYTFGTDPFLYTTEGVTCVNHAWLFDWALYGLYCLAGGAGVVVFRGLLLVALAATLLGIRRPGQGLWLPALCTALALLTLSARIPLQPMLVSLLFLGLTLYLLHRATDEGRDLTLGGRRFSPLWLLPVLFALWVNLDGLFVFGPLAVLLYLIGAGAQRLTAEAPAAAQARASAGDARTLGLVLVLGLAACLLNPFTYRAFELPVELAYPLAGVLPEGLVARGVAAERATAQLPQLYPTYSPFAEIYWSNQAFGLNAAGMAYFPLLLLGIVSFGLLLLVPPQEAAGARRFPVGLFLLWLVLALLSAGNVRFVPLFAVVGGPAIALNFQELARRTRPGELTWGRYNGALLGRAATVLGGLVLLVLAWPGWLHALPDVPRRSHRVRLEIYREPSAELAGGRLTELLATGKLRRGFNLTPDGAYYLSWYAGGAARMFYDPRFLLPAQAAVDYALARRSLRDAVAATTGRRQPQPGERPLSDLERVFRDYDINYLVLTDLNSSPEMLDAVTRLTLEPARWAPLYNDGRTAVYGWRDLHRPDDPFAGLTLQPERAAFGEVPEGRRAPAAAPVPPDGPPSLWERYAFGQPPSPLAMNEAQAYLSAYLMLSPGQSRWQHPFQIGYLLACTGWSAGTAGPAMPALPESGLLHVTATRDFAMAFTFAILNNSPGPPELPILAVRAARRSAAADPGDAPTYAVLARAYQVLGRQQELHWLRQLFGPRVGPKVVALPQTLLQRETLRHVQYTAALRQAVTLQPDDAFHHFLLAQLFEENNFPDAALEHAQFARAHVEALRRRLGEGPQAEKMRENIEDLERRLRDEVDRRREEYERLSVADRTLTAKVETALYKETRVPRKGGVLKMPRGLVKLAMKLMAETDPSSLPAQERQMIARLQIHIMLLLGMTHELRETVFDAEGRRRLQPVLGLEYDRFEALYEAAVGNYADADKALAAVAAPLEISKYLKELPGLLEKRKAEQGVRMQILALMAPPTVPNVLRQERKLRDWAMKFNELMVRIQGSGSRVSVAADLLTLRGLLALEQGDNARALAHFRDALRMAYGVADFGGLPLAMQYVSRLEKYWGQAGR